MEPAPSLRHRHLRPVGETHPWALVKDPGDWKPSQREVIDRLRRERPPSTGHGSSRKPWATSTGQLDRWLAWACRSFVKLSRTIRVERDRILAAVELGLSNSKLEGLNSKTRLINHRGHGHHTPAVLIAMIYLCCGGITVELPTGT